MDIASFIGLAAVIGVMLITILLSGDIAGYIDIPSII
jgi:hypothetical protein